MKIFEVVEPKFDLVDDTSFYMRNDPMFYRKEYFPAMASMADLHKQGKQVDRTTLEKMVDNGCSAYCQKYNLAKHPDEVFTKEHRDAIIDKLFAEEMDLIKQGEYA